MKRKSRRSLEWDVEHMKALLTLLRDQREAWAQAAYDAQEEVSVLRAENSRLRATVRQLTNRLHATEEPSIETRLERLRDGIQQSFQNRSE